MSLLATLGLLSLAVTVAFTIAAYRGTGGTGQSRRQSIIEVWVNICIGFSINWLMNWLVLPLVGASFSAAENFWLGCIYTGVSCIRGFAIRRFFNSHITRFVAFVDRVWQLTKENLDDLKVKLSTHR